MSSPLLPLWSVEVKIPIALYTEVHGEEGYCRSVGEDQRDVQIQPYAKMHTCNPACSNLGKIPSHLFPCLHCIFSGVTNAIIFHYFLCICERCNLSSFLIGTTILSTASFPCLIGIEFSVKNRVSHEEERRKVICKSE